MNASSFNLSQINAGDTGRANLVLSGMILWCDFSCTIHYQLLSRTLRSNALHLL